MKARKAGSNPLPLQVTAISCVESQPAKSGFSYPRADRDTGFWSCVEVKAVHSNASLLPLIQCFSEWFACGENVLFGNTVCNMRNSSQKKGR